MITYNNKDYEDLAQVAEDYNIPLHIFYNRLGYGWTLDKAVSKSVVERHNKPIVINNTPYRSYREVALKFNLSYEIIVERLNHDWSLEKIITTPSDVRTESVI